MLDVSIAIASEIEDKFPRDLDKVSDAASRHGLADEFGVGVFVTLTLADRCLHRRRIELRSRHLRLMSALTTWESPSAK